MRRFIVLALLLTPMLILANVNLNLSFDRPALRGTHFENVTARMMEAGNPELPYETVRILLPFGHSIESVEVNLTGEQTMYDVEIDYAPLQQPISIANPQLASRNEAVYRNDANFPGYTNKNLGVQRMNGYDILLLNVYPYQYNPAQKQLTWFTDADIEVVTSEDNTLREQQNQFLVQSDKVLASIARTVNNPQLATTYTKMNSRPPREVEGPYTMIIITDAQRQPYFTDFMTWKEEHGVTCGLFLVEDIYPEYEGIDHAEQVRNFIIDAYTTYAGTDTPLEFVLLGGDDEICPERGCYGQVGGTIDNRIPTDMYFGNLDGGWNDDGDEIWGELEDNPDLMPEVAIGRMSAETETEFNNIFNKTYYYTDQTTYSNDVAAMFGENLNTNPMTWGGDYKDMVSPILPDEFYIETRYERDNTFSTQEVIAAINDGIGIINHMGHSSQTYNMGLYNSNLSSLTNTEYGMAYSQGCYPAAFDQRTSQDGECIAENITNMEHGLFAYVGNTRYGWYAPGSVWGASEYYDISFFEGLFNENIRAIGEALNYSKVDLINEAAGGSVMLWIYYEMIVVGDPSVQIKDATGLFPYVTVEGASIEEIEGDGDGYINPGETVWIYVELANHEGWADAQQVVATISFEDESIIVDNGTSDYGFIPSGTTSSNALNPFQITVPDDTGFADINYTVEVTATSGEYSFVNSYSEVFSVSMFQSNWPWASGYDFKAAPIPYDMTDDGVMEILAISDELEIIALDINAAMLDDYPVVNNERIWRSTAFEDINQDGQPDIVFASRLGKIGAYNLDGTQIFRNDDVAEQLMTPVVADIDGDSQWDVISLGIDGNLHAINHNGNEMNGFPIELESTLAEIAAADMDSDGTDEIIVGTNVGNVYVLHYDGSNLEGFPIALGSGVIGAPVVLPDHSIVLGTQDEKLYRIAADGEILLELEIAGRVANSVIAADFDNDLGVELAFNTHNGYIYAMEKNGVILEGFPIETSVTFINPPLAADFDNDDEVEIISFSSLSNLYAYNPDGSSIGFSPVPILLGGNTPGTIIDLDGDNDLEFMCGNASGVVIVDCKMQKGMKMPWYTYRGNLRRTGYYPDSPTDTDDPTAPEFSTELKGNFPNPFNPTTTIAFSLAKKANVELSVYNIRGQKVKTLVSGAMDSGEHRIEWDGSDETGKSTSSGVYFYRLNAGGYDHVRKMLMIK